MCPCFSKTNLKALSEKELARFIERLGQKPYRTRQIINWIYNKHITSIHEMTDLPLTFRERLEKKAYISNVKLLKKQTSKDGTQKFLFELEDGEKIESVLIPVDTTQSRNKNRLTLCLSSQVGCAMGCKFCITGMLGLKRNLKAYEIVDQIIAVQRLTASIRQITNIVFMGMGEPLHNFTEVIEALWKIVGPLGFSKRKVTLSTTGITPKISELAKNGPRINLAISLNATTDMVRSKIMPVNKKYPLRELFNACKKFPLGPRRKITFEYVLMDGINDSKEDALRLTKSLKGIKSKLNLIPYNQAVTAGEVIPPSPLLLKGGYGGIISKNGVIKSVGVHSGFRKPSEDKIIAFQKILLDAGITAMIRKSMGEDISAACGQLRASYLPSNSETPFKSW